MNKKVEFDEATKKAFKNKVFVKKLLSLETGEEVRKALAEKGIVLTVDELDKFAEILVMALEKGEEMTDSDLENVVGGALSISRFVPFLADTTLDLGGLAENSYFARRKEHLEKSGRFPFKSRG